MDKFSVDVPGVKLENRGGFSEGLLHLVCFGQNLDARPLEGAHPGQLGLAAV